MTAIERIAVIGAGAMGVQIALLCALGGKELTLVEPFGPVRESAATRAAGIIGREQDRGRVNPDHGAAALGRIRVVSDIQDVDEADLALEAVTEDREIKRKVLSELDSRFDDRTIIASNSSSFVPSSLTADVAQRDRFLNIHFFNPVLRMQCVELIAGPETDPDVLERSRTLVTSLGRVPITVKKEIPGFIANRILNAVRDEALHLYEDGYADIDAIDQASRLALGYPMGPFELMDLTGIDIGYLTKKARFEETDDPADAPSRTVASLVASGRLGRKTGEGFYHYDSDGHRGDPAL